MFWVWFFIPGWIIIAAGGVLYAKTNKKPLPLSRQKLYSSKELLIQFKSKIKLNSSHFLSSKVASGHFQLDSLNSLFQLREIVPLFINKNDSSTSNEKSTISQLYLFKFAAVSSLSKLKKSYEALDMVEFAEFNYLYFSDQSIAKNTSSLLQSQLEEAGQYLNPNHSVIIGIIDTGIDWKRRNLIADIWSNPLEKLDGKDNDANGFIDDIRGWNFVDKDLINQFNLIWEDRPIDYAAHGTQIAEVISQVSNFRFSDLDNKTKNQLMILKAGVSSPEGKIIFTASALAQAIVYAADNGARVIILSCNSENPSHVLLRAIDYAVSKGGFIIAAAGDNNSNQPHYPAAFENVLAVTATDDDDKKLNDSNYGYWINLVAPGLTNVNSFASDSIRFIPSGTVIAAANVAGFAGLLLSCEDIVDSDSLKRRILWSSENIYHKNSEYSGKLGAGRINVLRAINSQHHSNIIIKKISYPFKSKTQNLFYFDIIPVTINILNLSFTAQDVNIKLTTNDPNLSVLKSQITIPHLDYKQQFTNEFDPFQLIVNNDYPSRHEANLLVRISTLDGFSLEQDFVFFNRIIFPSNLVIINDNPVHLKWTGNPEFISYHIYRKENEQQSYSRITEIPILSTTYVDPTVTPGNQYSYQVTGIDSSGWESPPSDVMTIKLQINHKFFFFPTQDTVISNQDSIRFSVLPQFNNNDEYTYQWFVNGKVVSNDSNNFFIDSYLFQNDNSDTVKVTINPIKLDTTIMHHWIISLKDTIKELKIKSVFPASDKTLNAGDSLKFHISLENTKDDSLEFQWQINGKVVEQKRDSVFIFRSDSLSKISNLITVSVTSKATVISHSWNIYIKPVLITFDQFISSPKSDTTIHSGDSIIFRINPISDNLIYQWFVNDEHDSLQTENFYIYQAPVDSSGAVIISLRIGFKDTTYSHQWYVDFESNPELASSVSYFPNGDTTIYEGDSLNLMIQNAHQNDSLKNFHWRINNETDSSNNQSSYKLITNYFSAGIDTIVLNYTIGDSTVYHKWLITILNRNRSPEIISCSPPLDSTLTKADSILFRTHCNDPDGDALRFTWLLNSWIDTTAYDSSYWYHSLNSKQANDTLILIAADVDTSIKLEWIIWAKKFELTPVKNAIRWFPEQDSLITVSDSLIFMVQNASDSSRFQWKINSQVDSSARDSIFVYHHPQDSTVVDTIQVYVFDKDSLFSHHWYIHHSDSKEHRPTLRLIFKPKQNVVNASPDDSLKFSVQVVEGNFADLVFHWSNQNQLYATAEDTIFCYYVKNFPITPDTIQLIVSRQDTTILHRWIVHFYQQQLLPAPYLIFPTKGNRVCEEDKLTWENDSTLAQFDSIHDFKYLVQLSKDTTFSNVILSDSCVTTSKQFNNLSKFDLISIGKPIFWRVKIVASQNQFSKFSKCDMPFYYYPQFAQIENFYGEKNTDGTIDLFWITGYESNCEGFNVYRSESQDDNFAMLNENLITGQINYTYLDKTAQAGKTYFYKLEDISLNGKKRFHQTISVTTPTPYKFSLSQNYPNPFNMQTSIKYEIPTATHVKIIVCNVLGRKLKTLVDENKEAGFYTVYWDGIDDEGENVVSGIYFYTMATIGDKITRKMIIVR